MFYLEFEKGYLISKTAGEEVRMGQAIIAGGREIFIEKTNHRALLQGQEKRPPICNRPFNTLKDMLKRSQQEPDTSNQAA